MKIKTINEYSILSIGGASGRTYFPSRVYFLFSRENFA